MKRIFILGLLAFLAGCGSDDSGGSEETPDITGAWEYNLTDAYCTLYYTFSGDTYSETVACVTLDAGYKNVINKGLYYVSSGAINLTPTYGSCGMSAAKAIAFSISEGNLLITTPRGVLTLTPSDFTGDKPATCLDTPE